MFITSGDSGGEIVARLKRDLLPTLLNGLLYWPFCDFATFRFVPVHLQVQFFSILLLMKRDIFRGTVQPQLTNGATSWLVGFNDIRIVELISNYLACIY